MAEHYFTQDPSAKSRPRSIVFRLPDRTLTFSTDDGVFSPDQIDPGTRALLDIAPDPPETKSRILDGGCGYGAIAVTLAARSAQSQVYAVDVNARARALCDANAAANGCANVTVAEPDELPGLGPFDVMYSNPPIRIGKAPMRALLVSWLDRLVPAGHAYWVVHKHLGADSLARWLESEGYSVERLGSRSGYRVLDVRTAAPSL